MEEREFSTGFAGGAARASGTPRLGGDKFRRRHRKKKREIPRLRGPTASQERSGKRKSACFARNDSGWGGELSRAAFWNLSLAV